MTLDAAAIAPAETQGRVLVLANAAAGSLRDQQHEMLADIAEQFRRVQMTATIESLPAAELSARAARAVDEGLRTIVAAGGDGTVSCVAAAIVDGPARLGIVPLGTFNHFARDLGIPLEAEQAVQTIAAQHVRRVDVGEVNGHTFVNNASLGIYPAMVLDRERLSSRWGRSKWAAMLLASWRVLRRFPLLQVRLALGAEAPWCTTPLVFVGNNRYRFDLLALGSRPQLDRGRLSLYAAQATTRAAMLRLGLRAAIGKLEQDDDAITAELAVFWIESRRPQLAVGLDGELVRLEPPLHFRSRPQALQVLAPPTDAGLVIVPR